MSLLQGDVYPVEPYDDLLMKQVLDAHWGVLYDEDVRYIYMFEYPLNIFWSFLIDNNGIYTGRSTQGIRIEWLTYYGDF